MSSKPYKFKKRGSARFVKLTHQILNSDAWRSCSPPARVVWIGLVMRFNGINNGRIVYSCREAAEHAGIGKNTAAIALIQLMEVGLIECVTESNFDCRKKLAREWALTHEPVDGRPASSKWKEYKIKVSPKLKRYSPNSDTDYLKVVE